MATKKEECEAALAAARDGLGDYFADIEGDLSKAPTMYADSRILLVKNAALALLAHQSEAEAERPDSPKVAGCGAETSTIEKRISQAQEKLMAELDRRFTERRISALQSRPGGAGDASSAAAPEMDYEDSLTEDDRALLLEENRLRGIFSDKRADTAIDDPHVNLVDVFEHIRKDGPLLREAFEEHYPCLLGEFTASMYKRGAPGSAAICKDMDTFKSNFDACYPNLRDALEGLGEGKLRWFIAGGAVLQALMYDDEANRDCFGTSNDVDIFIYGQGASETDGDDATQLARSIFQSLEDACHPRSIHVSRSQYVINITCAEARKGLEKGETVVARPYGSDGYAMTGAAASMDVQVILRLYQSPSEVLLGFDCDPCCVGFDGNVVWALPRALRALRTGRTVLNPLHAWPNLPSCE